MEAVSSVKELQQRLAAGGSCKIKLPPSEKMDAAIREANVSDKLAVGIQLIPRDITKILLAAVCEVGTVAAKAPFEGYALGLKRKPDGLYLYFSKHAPGEGKSPPKPAGDLES